MMNREIEYIKQLIKEEEFLNIDSIAKILTDTFKSEDETFHLNDFFNFGDLPVQTFTAQQFSQFPLTLLNERNLHLDLYHWSDSHTSIHDHNFQGAFKILKGSYRQKRYEFKSKLKVFEWLEIGDLTLKEDKNLLPGNVIKIPMGSNFIHSSEHQSGECLTVCLRSAVTEGPIHTYIAPSLKLRHVSINPRSQKILDYIQYLALDFSKNEIKIKEVLTLLDSNILFQVVFSYNVPKWLSRSEIRSLAYKKLKELFGSEIWFESVRDSFLHEKLSSIN